MVKNKLFLEVGINHFGSTKLAKEYLKFFLNSDFKYLTFMIHNQNFRRLFIFGAFFMATRDIICAIILTIIFVLIVSELFSEEEILFLDKDEGNGSNPQLENEKKIQSMIDELNELKNKL